MPIVRQLKNLNKRVNAPSIYGQYIVPYSVQSNSRYKHIDELDLEEGVMIKASMGPIDLGIYPYSSPSVYVVSQSDEGRLDVIATKVYGYASLWWAIAYANNISDPFSDDIIKPGKVLRIPRFEDLRTFPNPLS